MMFENIKNADDLKQVSREERWQNFERLVAFVFEKNDFDVEVNIVKVFNGRRRQYDVVANSLSNLFLVECKRWTGPYKNSELKKAVEKHIERCRLWQENKEIIPIVVTLQEEDLKIYEGMPIVPIEKLNNFINNLESFEFDILRIKW